MTIEQILLGVVAAYNGVISYFLKSTIQDIKEAKIKQQEIADGSWAIFKHVGFTSNILEEVENPEFKQA